MKTSLLTKDILADLYLNQNLTDFQIAEKFQCHYVTISGYRKKWGIKGINCQQRRYLEVPQKPLTTRQISIIAGSLIGDASIKGKTSDRRVLSISHSDKQKEYINWLYEELKSICPSPPKPYVDKYGYITYNLLSESRKDLFEWRNKIYIPKKTVNDWWLSYVDELSIAIWFMDDGSLNYKNKTLSYFSFATNSFTEEENYLLKKMLIDKFGIHSNVHQIKRGKDYQCNLVISDDSFKDFVCMVEPHMPDFMWYKLPGKSRDLFLSNNIDSNITKNQLKKLYYEDRLTQQQISETLGVHRLTVSKYMNMYKIKPRDYKAAQLHGKNGRYTRGVDGRFYSSGNSEDEMVRAKVLFRQMRQKDFPYPDVADDNAYVDILERLCSRNISFVENRLVYSPIGIKICSDLCPQIYEMGAKGSLSPVEIFKDDNLLIDSIRRTLKYAEKDTIASIRSGFKTYKNNRSVGLFPPIWAKSVLCDLNINPNSKLLDFSCGFGGRLIGSYTSGKIKYYMGIDPLMSNINSHNKILQIIKKHAVLNSKSFEADFVCGCAEDVIFSLNDRYDIIMTSPPYFDKELYAKNSDQSYLKYPNYDQWINLWLKPVLKGAYDLLNDNGLMIIFASDYGKINFGQDSKSIMEGLFQKVGYRLFKVPRVEYSRKKNNEKYDCCYIGKK